MFSRKPPPRAEPCEPSERRRVSQCADVGRLDATTACLSSFDFLVGVSGLSPRKTFEYYYSRQRRKISWSSKNRNVMFASCNAETPFPLCFYGQPKWNRLGRLGKSWQFTHRLQADIFYRSCSIAHNWNYRVVVEVNRVLLRTLQTLKHFFFSRSALPTEASESKNYFQRRSKYRKSPGIVNIQTIQFRKRALP